MKGKREREERERKSEMDTRRETGNYVFIEDAATNEIYTRLFVVSVRCV